MALFDLPPIEAVPLSYLTLVALLSVSVLLGRLGKLKRDELRYKDRQIQAAMDKDKRIFELVERQNAQMVEVSRSNAEAIYATNRMADAVSANTSAVKDSLATLQDAVNDGFKRTMALNQENNRAIAHTQTMQERRMQEVHNTLDRLQDTIHQQYRTLTDVVELRGADDAKALHDLQLSVKDIKNTLNNVTVGLQRLSVLIDERPLRVVPKVETKQENTEHGNNE